MYDVIHVLDCLLCSTVTAQDVSLEAQPPQPSCTNSTLTLNCQLSFSSLSIQWVNSSLGLRAELSSSNSVGDTVNIMDGRIIVNLTQKDPGDTGSRFLFSSTLTIYPPLNDFNNTNLNNSNIICRAVDRDLNLRSGDAPISLYGEQLRLHLIMCKCSTHCLCMYPLQVSLPLLMT